MQSVVLRFNNQDLKLYLRDEVDQSVMREIFKLREYRAAEAIIKTAKDPVVDVGAHAGFFSIYCRALNPKVKIYALEPDENNLKSFAAHVKENNLKSIRLAPVALSGASGERLLAKSDDSHRHYLVPSGLSAKTTVPVESLSLTDFCQQYKITKISLLKMDIEGGEFEVLQSLQPSEFALFKSIILEYHNSRGHDHAALEKLLREQGFGVQIFPSKFDKKLGFLFGINKRI